MSKSLNHFIAELPKARQESIEKMASEMIDEELSLRELRRARHVSQQQLATVLKVNQAAVSKLERRTDMYISTLRSYVEAMGGRLDVVVQFPDHKPVRLSNLADVEGELELA